MDSWTPERFQQQHDRLQARIAEVLMDEEGQQSKTTQQAEVKAPPHDRQIITEELMAIHAMFTALEALPPPAQMRCLRFVSEFVQEMAQRDHLLTKQLQESAFDYAAPQAQPADPRRYD